MQEWQDSILPPSLVSHTLTYDENVACVKARLQEEGREARNLIAYSLPLRKRKKNPTSCLTSDKANKVGLHQPKQDKKFPGDISRFKQINRHRSASAGRDPQAGLRARHWGFLFRNLEQAVDEIYQTAEDDESIIECKEAILMLERYASDFYKLIEWLNIKRKYENTSVPDRPRSLTWEIRTSSPWKLPKLGKKNLTSIQIKKALQHEKNLTENLISDKKQILKESKSNNIDQQNTSKLTLEKSRVENHSTLNSNNLTVNLTRNIDSNYIAGSKNEFNSWEENEENSSSCNILSGSTNKPTEEKSSDLLKKKSNSSPNDKIQMPMEKVAKAKCGEVVMKVNENKQTLVENKRLEKKNGDNEEKINSLKSKEMGKCALFEANSMLVESDVKKSAESGHTKNSSNKLLAPLVNMNKASEVRKAYNQNRTPAVKQKADQVLSRKKLSQGSEVQDSLLKQAIRGNRSVGGRVPDAKLRPPPSICRRSEVKNFKVELKRDRNPVKGIIQQQKALIRSATTLDGYSKENKKFVVPMTESGRCNSSLSLTFAGSSLSSKSWADKVRGHSSGKNSLISERTLSNDDDNEGWEVVRRHRRSAQGGSSGSLSSGGEGSTSRAMNNPNRYQHKRGSFSHHMHTRFKEPSPAYSMPSLSTEISYCNANSVNKIMPLKKSSIKFVHIENNGKEKNASKLNSVNTNKCSQVNNSKKRTKITKHNISDDIKNYSSSRSEVADNIKRRKNSVNVKTRSQSKINSESPMIDKVTKENLENSPNSTEPVSECNKVIQIDSKTESSYVPKDLRKKKEKGEVSPDLHFKGNEIQMCEEFTRDKITSDESQKPAVDKRFDNVKDTKTEIHSENEKDLSYSEENEEVDDFYEYESTLDNLNSLSWAEEMDAIDTMNAIRPPGRVLHIHEKLSSPSRKLPISEKIRRHQEKLAKAQELRGKLIMAKTEKLKGLFRKIDEVNTDKERLLMEKRDQFERKMERAEENRRSHLQEIVNKAHDEENKAKEIAFINGLEAQNKLFDIKQQHQCHESRLADIAEVRSRKQEEKAAKEAAAQERRKALEAERQARMLELWEKHCKRFERIDQRQAEKREELLEQAREKARDREERLSALQQAQQAKEFELVKKIQQKLEETTRRHDENIELIRQKALESSIMKYSRGSDEAPQLKRYETKKLCTICNSVIPSEVYLLSHLRGRKHQEALNVFHKSSVSREESETYNLKFIVDAPANIDDPRITKNEERQKSLKKRLKKIRSRMATRGNTFMKDYYLPDCKDTPFKKRLSKCLAQIGKLISNQGSGPWSKADVSLLDKNLLDILRILEKGGNNEPRIFASLDGFRRLLNVMNVIIKEESDMESPCVVPSRSLSICTKVLNTVCVESTENCRFLILSNIICAFIDQLVQRLNEIIFNANLTGNDLTYRVGSPTLILHSDSVVTSLTELISQILRVLTDSHLKENIEEYDIYAKLQDVVSYCVSMGVADKISWYFNHVQNGIGNDAASGGFILGTMCLLSSLAGVLSYRSVPNDPTHLIATFHTLDACGVVSLLYGLLLYQGGRSSSPPPPGVLSPSTLDISTISTAFLIHLAELDLQMFQDILGSEGISLEFRHIASFLFWYCSFWPCENVLHNIITLVGFFAVNNKENQSIIQSGETPSVLQQLCGLPWQYFSESHLMDVLFPSLLACCLHNQDNLNIVKQEMSFQALQDYLKDRKDSKKPLMKILHSIKVDK